MRLSHKIVVNTSSNDDAQLGLPVAFEYAHDQWWAICGDRVFTNSSELATGGFDEDDSTGFSTNFDVYSDLAVFDNKLWACSDSELLSKSTAGGAWSDETGSASLGGETQKLAYLKKFDRLYFIENDDEVGSIDRDGNLALESDYYINLNNPTSRISTMVASSTEIWIAMSKNTNGASDGTQAEILRWDGISAQVTNSYKVNAGLILAMCVHEEIPYALDSFGRLLQFVGVGFKEIQRLPGNNVMLTDATQSSPSDGRFVHQNGMIPTKNNTILIGVNNLNYDSTSSINENLPSGVWEYDLSTGNFTHRYSFSLKGRTDETLTDYGQNRISQIGAIKEQTLADDNSDGQCSLLLGATIYSDENTELSAIFNDYPDNPNPDSSNDRELQKRGYFVTTWFNSPEIVDKWVRLWTTFKRFKNSTDKIIFKYRLEEEDPLEIDITWTSTTTFTTTEDITAYDPSNFNGTVGGEVEVIQGTGGGACVHIIDISESGGTYTVTIDNEITGVTGTAKVRLQKWIKLVDEVTGTVKSYSEINMHASNTRIQIKGVLEWSGDGEFHKMILVSNEDIKINK
jgi:hypothetical protein